MVTAAEEGFAVHAHTGQIEKLLLSQQIARNRLDDRLKAGFEAGVSRDWEFGLGEVLQSILCRVLDELGKIDGVVCLTEVVVKDGVRRLDRQAFEVFFEKRLVNIAL